MFEVTDEAFMDYCCVQYCVMQTFSVVFLFTEQEVERKLQEHSQEIERLQQKNALDSVSLEHTSKLKREQALVCKT